MNKAIVETKSRSKHVFEVNDEAITSLSSIMSDRGFDKMSYLKIKDTYFNPNNITSVKIEKVD